MAELAELSCPACEHTVVCGPAEMIDQLRRVGMVRRDVQPEADLLAELFRSSASKFACPQCGAVGLIVQTIDEGDDEAWGMARKCDVCGRPIDRERLEALPDARLCATCQASDERGEATGPADYCPKCGNVMVVRPTRTRGVTRYELSCPTCRR